MREKGMENFDNLLKVDVIQNFLSISKNSSSLDLWMNNCDEYINENFPKENTSFSHKIESKSYVRRENSSGSATEEYFMAVEPSKTHPLSKASLLNKTYFLVLLFEGKITSDNFVKVLQYFQNYYPQSYDANCSIWTFMHTNITESLKNWANPDINSAILAQNFFSKTCAEYELKINKRFQITK